MSDTSLAGNDVTYETHVEGEQPEPERAPISWLRQAATEIEAKKGNPNPGRTRQSRDALDSSPSARHTMSETTTGKLQQKDFTPEVDQLLPQATSLAQVGSPASRYCSRLDRRCFTLGRPAPGGTGEALRSREASTKRAFPLFSRYLLPVIAYIRQGSDLKSTTRLVKAIIELEYDARNYAQLNSSINVFSKKHGQLKGAIQAMVELAMSWLDDIKQRDGTEKWLELIETLRTVTEGKVRCALAASTCNSSPRNSYMHYPFSSSWRHHEHA